MADGDAQKRPRTRVSLEQRIRRQTRPAEGGCVEWVGATGGGGYGRINVLGRMRAVHRIAYIIAKGDVPDGLVIDHLCRNRKCVNPDHLEAVTQRVNTLRGNATKHLANRQCAHCGSTDGHVRQQSGNRVSWICHPCRKLQTKRNKVKRRTRELEQRLKQTLDSFGAEYFIHRPVEGTMPATTLVIRGNSAAISYVERRLSEATRAEADLAAAVSRAEKAERERDEAAGRHLPPALFSEYARLDVMWQELVKERDAMRAKVERAHNAARRILGGIRRQLASAGYTESWIPYSINALVHERDQMEIERDAMRAERDEARGERDLFESALNDMTAERDAATAKVAQLEQERCTCRKT